MDASRNHLAWVAGTCLCVIVLAAAFNYVIDPYNLFQAVELPGINTSKPATGNRTDFAKSYMVDRVRPGTLIVGASTIDIGLDPESPFLPADARPAFNLAVPGSSVYEHFRLTQHAGAGRQPAVIVMGLEFDSFIILREEDGEYPPEAWAPAKERRLRVDYRGAVNHERTQQFIRDAFASLVSNVALGDSLRTIAAGERVWLSPYGLSSGAARFGAEIGGKGYYPVFRNKLREHAEQYSSERLRANPHAYRALDDMLEYCRARDIELVILIPPAHAFLYELWDRAGLWQQFENWKIEVTQRARQARAAGTRVRVLDFAVYNSLTTEPVPDQGHAEMQWFWDPLHFKTGFGDLLLRQVFSGEGVIPGGSELEGPEVCAHLAEIRAQRARYRREHPAQLELLARIVAEHLRVPDSSKPVDARCAGQIPARGAAE